MQQGVAWGFVDSVMLFLVGSVVLWSDTMILEQMAHSLEVVVGALMIVLGIDMLRRDRHDKVHFHIHKHNGGAQHIHAQSHIEQLQNFRLAPFIQPLPHGHHNHSQIKTHKKDWPIRVLFMGIIQGMAGSIALILLFVDPVDSISTGLAYIVILGWDQFWACLCSRW